MRLEHGPRRRPQKAGEVLGITPESDQPLEINLENVINRLERVPEIDFSEDTALLLGMIGGQPLKRLRRNLLRSYKKFADEGGNAILLEDYPGSTLDETATSLAICKLWKPKVFSKLRLNLEEKKTNLWEKLPFNRLGNTEPHSDILGYLILFPEEREQLLKRVREFEEYLVTRAEKEMDNDDTWTFIALAYLKMLNPGNKEIAAFARKHWAGERMALEREFNTVGTSTDREKIQDSAQYALRLGISMYILAAEKIVINDKGVLDVTPGRKKLAAGSALPERPVD